MHSVPRGLQKASHSEDIQAVFVVMVTDVQAVLVVMVMTLWLCL